jgi:hypothetical protein
VTVFYNPDATVLRGRPETWLRGSWNRWTHPQCFLPQLMQPVLPGGTGFLCSGTIQVWPLPALLAENSLRYCLPARLPACDWTMIQGRPFRRAGKLSRSTILMS